MNLVFFLITNYLAVLSICNAFHIFPKLKSATKCVSKAFCSVNELQFEFGNKLATSATLPTQDRYLVDKFLEDSEYIIENVWEKSKTRKISCDLYALKLFAIPIPGLDIIVPELEVQCENGRGSLHITSECCFLKGVEGKVIKDPNFISSFDFKLSAQLRVTPDNHEDEDNYTVQQKPLGGSKVKVEAFVKYKVKGIKPKVLQQASDSQFNAIVKFVEDCAHTMINERFSVKLIKAFKGYAAKSRLQEEW